MARSTRLNPRITTGEVAALNAALSSSIVATIGPTGTPVIPQNSDGTWPPRTNYQSDRTKLVIWEVKDATQLPTIAPTVTSGANLALPTPDDQFTQTTP